MNRKQLEAVAVRLYMLAMQHRIYKGRKEAALKQIRKEVTRWNEGYLIKFILNQITAMEAIT